MTQAGDAHSVFRIYDAETVVQKLETSEGLGFKFEPEDVGTHAYEEAWAKLQVGACLRNGERVPRSLIRTINAKGKPPFLRQFIASKTRLFLTTTAACLLVATLTVHNILWGIGEAVRQTRDFFLITVPLAYGWLSTDGNYRSVTGELFSVMVVCWLGLKAYQAINAYRARQARLAFEYAVELERASRPIPNIVSPYYRKENTVYGDARAADDFEVDQGLRDHIGGTTPLFKD